MMTLWGSLEIIGTAAFAVTGGLTAVRHRLDLFGILMLAVITAIGGGVLRDSLLGRVPPSSFRDPTFVLVALVVGLVIFFRHREIQKLESLVLFSDALGLGAFTATGSEVAVECGWNQPFMVIVFGLVTAIGGGILRDVLSGEVPFVFRKEIYALASIIGSAVFFFGQRFLHPIPNQYLCFAVTFVIRWIAVRKKLNLPTAEFPPEEKEAR